ncbi:hypothetical protein GWK47_006325 [Chionoecetes opilio]|uniref:Uncharacterized protein n=1 Tax=Chionoecetes opilio TaxID=41210 RepID=A0A8J4YD49_CHIOP|nr:hypothetical protein GWK47_006325 [Chionoecetes opilio]
MVEGDKLWENCCLCAATVALWWVWWSTMVPVGSKVRVASVLISVVLALEPVMSERAVLVHYNGVSPVPPRPRVRRGPQWSIEANLGHAGLEPRISASRLYPGWTMETQQQTSKVVEGVVTNICERLGPGAREHIGFDQLRASAKDWMENTCSVSEAIEAIAAPLHQHVRGKLAEKNIAVQKIKDELEKTSEEIMIVEKIRKKLEQETKHLQGASGQTVDEPRTAEPCATKHLEATRAEGDSLVRNNQVDSDDDDDDVVVIKTVPSKPPTLILLTDDSSEATSSSSSDDTSASSSDDVSSSTSECKSSSTSDDSVSVVRRWTESRDNPKPSTSMAGLDAVELEMATGFATQHRLIRERAMDLQDAENKGFTNMSLANLHQDELTLNERIKEIKSEEKRNVDHIAQEVKDMKTEAQTKDRMEIDGLQQHLIANVVDAIGGGGGGRDQAALNLLTDHLKPPSPNLPTAANLDMCVDENSNSTSVADIADFLSRLHPVGVHSNEMWEDAHYICSLLPYFSLRDVYQSMVDNIDHPDRRAFVLESYINLAVDRQETVQDVVFQGLWAARKRSHGEMAEPHTQVKKKRRTEHDPEANAKGVKQPVNLPQEVLPSTSKAGHFPVVISEPEPEVASGSSVTDFEFKFEDPASKKWYQAKMDFICAVVSGVERDMLWGQVVSCQTDADIEALIERLMEEHVDKPANPPAVPHPAENQPSTSADQSVAVAVAGRVMLTRPQVRVGAMRRPQVRVGVMRRPQVRVGVMKRWPALPVRTLQKTREASHQISRTGLQHRSRLCPRCLQMRILTTYRKGLS